MTSHYVPVKGVTNSAKDSGFDSAFYRQHTLRPNNIVVEEAQLDDERWSRHAFALGMPYGDIHRPNPEARRFVQRLQKRPQMGEKQLAEILVPLIGASTRSHRHLQVRTTTTFHEDAVPNGSGTGSRNSGWSMALPIPKPDMVVGFSPKTFKAHELELQSGIIANARGEPCDLSRVSQPTPDVFWPFFVVEIQRESLAAAQNAAAGSASTCNNALAMFAEAAEGASRPRQGRNIFWPSQRTVQSFSLSISGKRATLNLHHSEGGLCHRAAVVRLYELDDERDVEALVSRIGSICVWAENCRLPSILDLLESFNNVVQLESRDFVSDAFVNENLERVNGCSSGSLGAGRKRFGGFKSVLAELSPRWIRVQG